MKRLSVEEIRGLLSTVPLFREIPAKQCREIASRVGQLQIQAGETLCQRGDIGNCLYIVTSGRFRVFLDEDGPAVNEVEPCEFIGEIALLTGENRQVTVVAVRDSSVLVLPRESFNELTKRTPEFLLSLLRTQIQRLLRVQCPTSSPFNRSETIAIVPAGGNLAIDDFAIRFRHALSRLGDVVHLRSADKSVQSKLGHDFVEGRLQAREESSRFVIYESDNSVTDWTASCIRQADRVIFVADADATPGLNTIESQFERLRSARTLPRRDLVIVHSRQSTVFAREWLATRPIYMHHHIEKDDDDDYGRLARIVAGKAIGLVLSGGGARAFAHIGVIQALSEAGIPVDVIGGTSMGSLVGALSALDFSPARMTEICRYIFIERGVWDFTFPLVSLVAAKRITKSLSSIFSEVAIEDLRRNYFCISTNLSTGDVAVHQRGSLVKWLKASMAIPGIAPPTIDQGQLFYDGGLLNNLPVDVMSRFGIGHIFAVNISSFFDQRLVDVQGEHCSPWRILLNRINPFSRRIAFPSIFNILCRSAMLNCLRSTVAVQHNASLLINPKVSHYGLFQWKAIDEIVEAGRLEARNQLRHWSFVPSEGRYKEDVCPKILPI
jgi:predicted acylesterase/phospholipase RssA/CRP-like cAMP-binding protein